MFVKVDWEIFLISEMSHSTLCFFFRLDGDLFDSCFERVDMQQTVNVLSRLCSNLSL